MTRIHRLLCGLIINIVGLAALLMGPVVFPFDVWAATPAKAKSTPLPLDDEPLDRAHDTLSLKRWAELLPELERLPRRWIVIHTVTNDESLWDIAARYGLDVDTLRWSNPELEYNPDMIYPGQRLIILPLPGVYHTVKGHETVESLAQAYGVEAEDIINYPLNRLKPPYRLVKGQRLVIPYGRKRTYCPRPSLAPDYPFAWPAAGIITKGFQPGHGAIDIAVAYGCPVYAAGAGKVVRVDWDESGYWGFWVVIDHGNGLRTYYAHLKGATVVIGQRVERGQEIGRIGSTGNSTGPHVHFEIRENGRRCDPLTYLPPEP